MANICSFIMKAVGEEENLKMFNELIKNAKWRVYEYNIDEKGEKYTINGGSCAWSIAALTGGESNLFDICRKSNVAVEIFGEELGCCFKEHQIISNKGENELYESDDCYEFWVNDYESENEAREALKEAVGDDYNEDYVALEDDGRLYYKRLEVEWRI